MKMKTKKNSNNQSYLIPLGAGLLILGSLAPLFAGANERSGELSVQFDDGLVSLNAHNVAVQDVIQEIANQGNLRIVQHVALDRIITLAIDRQPLPEVLSAILRNDSYQLYQGVLNEDEIESLNPVPSTLWIFSKGTSLAPAATVFLEEVLYHGNYREKKEAIRELRRLGTSDAVHTLSFALSDEDPRVRNAAFEALSRIGGDEALAVIASASVDSDPWVRSLAANALSSGDAESAVQYLNLAFEDPDPKVRMAVIEAFADNPSEQAVAALSLALRDENPEVRMHAVDALDEIADEFAFQALMRAKSDKDRDGH